MTRRGVGKAVTDALADVPDDWRTTLARKLARTLDEEPNASMARELRALMAEIQHTPAKTGGTPLDELERRRSSRGAASAG